MGIARRTFLNGLGGAGAFAAMPRPGLAQAYPSRPITLMVFVGAGGAPDIVARVVAQALSQRLGQAVVIENRPGGGGNLALQAVARAPADGYTLLLIATPHAVNVTLYPQQDISVLRDIEPIASIDNDAFALVVNPQLPVKTVAELVGYLKANPGKVNMPSSGSGNLSHLAGELFKMMTGTEMVHVPYRGMPAANTATMTGEGQVLFNALPAVLSLIQEGKLRALAVTSAHRVKLLPNIPTIGETVPGYAVTGWLGFGAPKGTPAAVIERVNKEMNAVLTDPAILTQLDRLGSEPFTTSPAEFSQFIAAETKKWGEVVRFANLKVN
jgi:tripartite-type tricarboxylate transporter receptor subunit TctC